MQWVRWCNDGLPVETIDHLVLSLFELAEKSAYPRPILFAHAANNQYCAAGYLSIYPGALGVIGNLRVKVIDSDTVGDPLSEVSILAYVIHSLCMQAVDQGVEIVQAISTIEADSLESLLEVNGARIQNASEPPTQELALIQAKVMPIAKLVQMELETLPIRKRPAKKFEDSPSQEMSFVPFDEIPEQQWHMLIEATYSETLDVPELNGSRTICNTLQGYASSQDGPPVSWWAILMGEECMGCLLLSPIGTSCELTYLGFIPAFRGQGRSRHLMNFVLRWCETHGVDTLTLAVDSRNTPAIRLYKSYGFEIVRYVQAWIFSQYSQPKI